ncbi:type II secretion system F family protein [Salinibacterium sp. ZJ77]|uniref:type II secretion system F family protein n=1 Tax=Salinibacterium sp. ZJ77 TaxID=2708337 RepID=UPI00142072C0|nr:type II secretion system F family protein [Salinibacterium sp. ZJ77]
MSPTLGLAIAAGLTLGLGLWTLVALTPRFGARRLADRVAPYILDVSAEARALRARRTSEPGSVFAGLAAPLIERAQALLAQILGGDASVARRLRQAGSADPVAAFRSRQLAWAAGGAAAGVVAVVALSRTATVGPLATTLVGVLALAAGLLLPEQLLTRRARTRTARIADELPTVLEFLSLALAAGESVRDAIRRVARIGSGELAGELGGAVAEVDLGIPLADALERTASDLEVPSLSRAIEQLTVALERGSPLVDVLRAQAQDSREDAKRALIESAGRKEVAMLVPLVFLILPVTIVFALFPATLVLELGF